MIICRLKRHLGAFAAILLLALPASAQSSRFDVRGVVIDSTGAGLRGATVVALTLPDSVIAKFDVTGGDGAFTLRRVPAGNYVLQITFVGFSTIRRDFVLTGEALDLGRIELEESISDLDELVVSSDHIPFVVKRDTLEYLAGAFGARPNATVEDLLKRLPGIEVERDGSIKAQGEQVQNVLVDGKEFFGSDPTVATRNLPADAVNKVQVYDKQSDMAEFTGVRDGQEEKTINLELKPGAKHGYFGNVSGGVGDANIPSSDAASSSGDQRYDTQLSINRFSPTTQFAVIGNLNNINRQGFSFGDYMNFMGGAGGFMVMGDGGGRGSGPQIGTSLDDGFSETISLGLNASHDFGKRTSIRSSYFLSSIDNTQDRTSSQRQLLGADLSSLQTAKSLQSSGNWSHRLNLVGKHQFADGHDVSLRSNFSISNSTLDNTGSRSTFDALGLAQNKATTIYGSAADNLSGDASLTWRKRLNGRGRSLVGSLRLNLNDSDQSIDLNSVTELYEAGDVATYEELRLLQQQRSLGNTLTQTQRLSFTEPLHRGRVIETHVERRSVSEDQTRDVYDLRDKTLIPNLSLSSGLDRTYTYYRGGASFRRNSDRLSYGVGIDAQRSNLEGQVLAVDAPITSGYTNLLPSADVRYEFRQGMSLNVRYNTSTREPSMNELQPFEDNSDPLNVYVGNPLLRPEYRHSVNVHYMLFDQFTFVNLFTYLAFTYTKDKITRARTIDERFLQKTTSENADGDWRLNGSVNFGMPLRAIGAKIDLTVQPMISRGIEFLNGDENRTRILRNTIEARLGNRSKDLFDVSAGARFTFNDVNYQLNPAQNQSYVNRTLFGEGTVYFGESWVFTTSLDYRMYDQSVFGASPNVALLDATISRYFLAQKAEVQLTVRDLLDQNEGVSFSNSTNYVSEDRVISLGRYLMLKFVYHLSGSAGRKAGGINIRHMGD